MTTPATIPLAPDPEMTAAAWIATIPGFTAAMTGTVLPPDAGPDGTAAPWISTGFVTVAVAGGNPDPLLPLQRTVIDVQCWAAIPGSNRPPWPVAWALASAITRATWNRTTMNRVLVPAIRGVTYPAASVQGAKMLTSFRRLYSDAADYACVQGDLWIQWIAINDQIT